MMHGRIAAAVVASTGGLHCRLQALHAETLESKPGTPPVFVVRHAQSVQNLNQGTCIKNAQDSIEDVVARLLAKGAKRGDSEWESGCAEISRSLNRGRDWWRRWIVDDSHLPPELRERDAVLTAAGIVDTLKKADSQHEELPSEGRRKVLLIVSPLTRTMMTAALLFHRLPEHGIDIDLVLEPGVIETLYWPYDMVSCVGRDPDESLPEVRRLLSDVAPGAGVEVMIRKLEQAAAYLPASWWQKLHPIGQENKVTVLWDWGHGITDMEFVREHRENIFRSIGRHVNGRQNDYCAAYVVCHGMTIAKLVCEPTEPLDHRVIPRNLECRRIDMP